jgi:preprotein translocase subunit Sss1
VSRTEGQKEAENLLAMLEGPSTLPDPEFRAAVTKLCRYQQDEIQELQEIPKRISLGFKIVGGIGSAAAVVLTIIGSLLATKVYNFFKSLF